MIIKDIVELENHNTNMVYLHKEGIFYRLYNQSALWWYNNVKQYKLSAKYVKTIKANVISIGFPVSSWSTYYMQLNTNKIVDTTDNGYISIECNNKPSTKLVQDEAGKLLTKKENTICNYNDINKMVTEEIKVFPLANSTPFQAMEFVSKLKNMINA